MAKKILIVDDEPDMMSIARFRLEKAGYKVISAVNGREALEMTAKEQPDLVLLDLKLPLLSGTDVCLQLRKYDKLKNIPVILFTASTDKITDKVMACGAQDYIIKPFNAEELIGKIKKLIE